MSLPILPLNEMSVEEKRQTMEASPDSAAVESPAWHQEELAERMKASPRRIQESKRVFRQKLANAQIAQKLRMLDQLRLRTIAIKKPAKDYLSDL